MAEFNWVWGCIDIIVVILCDRCNCLFAAHVSTIPPTWLLARKHWIPDNRSCGAFNWTCPPCYHPCCCVCACVFVFLCMCICLLLHFIEPVHTFPSDKLCCLVPHWANWQRLCHFTYLCLQRARHWLLPMHAEWNFCFFLKQREDFNVVTKATQFVQYHLQTLICLNIKGCTLLSQQQHVYPYQRREKRWWVQRKE